MNKYFVSAHSIGDLKLCCQHLKNASTEPTTFETECSLHRVLSEFFRKKMNFKKTNCDVRFGHVFFAMSDSKKHLIKIRPMISQNFFMNMLTGIQQNVYLGIHQALAIDQNTTKKHGSLCVYPTFKHRKDNKRLF